MSGYRPRRQSARWLDGDCPRGVLAIYDNGGLSKRNGSLDRYTIFYVPELHGDEDRGMWIDLIGTSETGNFSGHEQMRAYQVADYRFRNAHRATTWTSLPEPVKRMVRADLAPEETDSRCATCRVPEHDQCADVADCPCCRDARRDD